jgi:SAM-dependent methyltransferase
MKEKIRKNAFRECAWLYDMATVFDDLDFYLERAVRHGSPVLELACGTGRIGIPLAEAGHEVWGLDLSDEMLLEYGKKMSSLPSETRARLHINNGDMAEFDLDREFPLIIIPYRSFQGLTEPEERKSCLSCVLNHLAPNGIFILNTFQPYGHLDQSWCQSETIFRVLEPKNTGIRIRVADHRKWIDIERQVLQPDLIYYVTFPDGTEERVVEPLTLAYFYEDQLRSLLQNHGFEIIEAIGDYDGTPVGQGNEFIFVCRARSDK